jgi:hypothetical protein
MQDVAHDVLSIFHLDGAAGKEIGDVDWQAGQPTTAGIAEEVPVRPLNFLYISCEESLHHRTKVVFVNGEPLIADVESFAGAFLPELRLLIGCDDSFHECGVVLIGSLTWDKIARNQIGAKVRVVGKSFLTGLNCVDHVSAVDHSSLDTRCQFPWLQKDRKIHILLLSDQIREMPGRLDLACFLLFF